MLLSKRMEKDMEITCLFHYFIQLWLNQDFLVLNNSRSIDKNPRKSPEGYLIKTLHNLYAYRDVSFSTLKIVSFANGFYLKEDENSILMQKKVQFATKKSLEL